MSMTLACFLHPLSGLADADGNQKHLLAALVGPDAAPRVVAPPARVGATTTEVPMAVLESIDLNTTIVTADAWHPVKATANHIHQRGGHCVLPVTQNRRALFDALDVLASRDS
jgi:hypothetical protein